MRRVLRRLVAGAMVLMMVIGLAGCGSAGQETVQEAVQIGIDGYVYVPEFEVLESDNGIYNIRLDGDKLFYSSYEWNEETMEGKESYYTRDVAKGSVATELTVKLPESGSVSGMVYDEEGNSYCFLMDYSNGKESAEGYMIPEVYLCKADAQGNELLRENVTEKISDGSDYLYIDTVVIDGEQQIYASCEQNIFLFDARGQFHGKLECSDWISGMGKGKDGRVYFTQWDPNGNGMLLNAIDFRTKSVADTYQNFPSGNSGGSLSTGAEYDFLINDGSTLYGYSIADQEKKPILKWLDSDINGQYVNAVTGLEDGRLVALVNDWSGESSVTELVTLTKTESSAVAERELVVIGTFSANQDLQASAVRFNKNNGQYRVTIREYADYENWTENSYQETLMAMNNDLTGKNPPDILDLSNGLDMNTLVSKGLLEDLGAWLDQSQTLKREDFVTSVLDAYTIEDTLVCIPTGFYVGTVFGRTSQVGAESGWTTEDMMALMDQYPEAEVFDYATRSTILHTCLAMSQDAFIDWENGSCNFDSEEFKKVLELAARFPKEYEYSEEELSTPEKLMAGEVLLNQTTVYEATELSIELQMFGGEQVTNIGYPTVDGTPGVTLQGENSYAIVSSSKQKEGAWAFLESLLQPASATSNRYRMGFPVRQEELDSLLAEASTVRYRLDEKGEPILDEEGNPIEEGYGTWGWGNNFSLTARALTEAEVEMLRDMIAMARPGSSAGEQIFSIIAEDAESFFEGGKSVDEVADIIQRRVMIYISDNSY